jgi:hypothetical protein
VSSWETATRGRHREGKVLTEAIRKVEKVPETADLTLSSYQQHIHRMNGPIYSELSTFQQEAL